MKTKNQSPYVVGTITKTNKDGSFQVTPDIQTSDEEILEKVLEDITFDSQPFGEYLMCGGTTYNEKGEIITMKNENIFVQIIKKAIALTREACEKNNLSIQTLKEVSELSFKKGQKAERERILEMIDVLQNKWKDDIEPIYGQLEELKKEIER